jgi:hypothetical protein
VRQGFELDQWINHFGFPPDNGHEVAQDTLHLLGEVRLLDGPKVSLAPNYMHEIGCHQTLKLDIKSVGLTVGPVLPFGSKELTCTMDPTT